MLKTILQITILSSFLISCCNCDCPDADAETEIAAITEEGHKVVTIDSSDVLPQVTTSQNPTPEAIDATQKKLIEVTSEAENNDTKLKPLNLNELLGDNGLEGDGNNPVNNEGSSFGDGTVDSQEESIEDSPIRSRLSEVDQSTIKSATDETITLQIAIDGGGNVTKANVIKSKTTTTDQELISQVIKAVKQQVKYSRNTGASLKYDVYTVKVKAN